MKNSEGQKVPQVVFKTRTPEGQWQDVSSDEIFTGKTVVLFALPGAFTPTCSSTHVPGYNALAPVFRENGVDEIVCLSVNDAFVMDAWKKDQGADQIRFLPDGNGEFSEAMELLVDKSEIGFGKRSWRYSMLVRNGKIEKMFIEPEKPGDPFEVSDADTMLAYLNPEAKAPEYISLITRAGCPHCTRAKTLLKNRGLAFEEIELNEQITTRSIEAITGRATTPQVFIGGRHIGGADELAAFLGE
ncbi:glutathione peroxidase [bacterium (Candidatus Blackallbacteria) CG17_big_fil_post_rev_8_21_14_2_50_48_46]|uniref:Glutathione peroxidase n=1 Tax=bacterium (Candidatus Blackallbacteria) CG17_big_fil_post_rev_8_21_14_2_50_48_46 TaxID=2014261 RepID=A0A2M7GB95_9BACT|nr:MAG: glutathione peroxidase [bacterium (Candidatus Blackallbacteria) CG18_big_fil_WC_8_21_14_2_50_49_26]PIW19459.1 MAG: glutathione peroxidase [bacterium (Candidatus Blackallbacteria) CG17_big_fil_post_rev_8_21_14_2_50_48_46]PIW48937.1 MAG: glutathione peroxidase [bacterium (Candidatus Blackallbacteria) CG13_big_fil_rev_8_21_14_2_50_49_14]